eukprot:4711330-Ditylum_brightwellii.AAC.1
MHTMIMITRQDNTMRQCNENHDTRQGNTIMMKQANTMRTVIQDESMPYNEMRQYHNNETRQYNENHDTRQDNTTIMRQDNTMIMR